MSERSKIVAVLKTNLIEVNVHPLKLEVRGSIVPRKDISPDATQVHVIHLHSGSIKAMFP